MSFLATTAGRNRSQATGDYATLAGLGCGGAVAGIGIERSSAGAGACRVRLVGLAGASAGGDLQPGAR